MHETSERYHRRSSPERVRWQISGGGNFSSSSSRPDIVSPYGNLPYNIAGRFGGGYSDPLASLLGFGPSSGPGSKIYGKEQSQLDTATGPLADFIKQVRGFLPGVFGQAQAAGQTAATQAPLLYNQLQGQVGNVLGELPNWNNIASQITSGALGNVGQANQGVSQAFSPVVNNALFSNANVNALNTLRSTGGARGLVDAGTQQAAEEMTTRGQAADFAQQQFQNQQQALQGAANANQVAQGAQAGQVATGQVGIPAAQAGQGGLGDLLSGLTAAFGIPMGALGDVGNMLAGAQNPMMQLLSMVGPQLGQISKSKGWGTQQSAGL